MRERTRICASVSEATDAAVRAAMDRCAPHCDLIELRLDAAPPAALDVTALVEGAPRPLVVTFRPSREGGGYDGPEGPRLAALGAAARAGAAYVDVEWDAADALPEVPARVIVSRHPRAEPKGDELPALLASVRHPRAAVQKLAVPASDAATALRLLDLAAAEATPTVAIAMGFAGVASRVAGAIGGAPFVYAAADPQRPTAPGQLAAERLHALWSGRRLSRASALYGVAGRPVAHSKSPELHNAAFAALGVDAVYTWLETSDLAGLLAAAPAALRGLSVTIPHKQAALQAPNVAPDALARAIGAANTLVRADGGWTAHNTDALAAEALLGAALARRGAGADRARVALLGSGGAARALANAGARAGARVTVFARNAAAGMALAQGAGARWGGALDQVPAAGPFAAVVNATSVGMAPGPDVSPVAPEAFGPGVLAYDLVYAPVETRFLRDARARGAETLDGLVHLAAQARGQLELWLGAERVAALPDGFLRQQAR